MRDRRAIGTAINSIAMAMMVSVVAGCSPSNEELVPAGYAMIPEAKQIDDLFGPAWHSVANFGEPDRAQWITTALFGGRYELEMVVDVKIDRPARKIKEVVGEPRFVLHEVREVKKEGQERIEVTYEPGSQREFRIDKWQQLVKAKGDFSAIGVKLNPNPAPGFDRYVAYPRNGLRMSKNTNPVGKPKR